MKKNIWILFFCLIYGSLFAEIKTWTTLDGGTFEGELAGEEFGELRFFDERNDVRFVPFESLSPKDRYYISHRFHPEIEASVSVSDEADPWPEWYRGYADLFYLYSFDVKLEKQTLIPCKDKLLAELYILGKSVDGGNYVLVERVLSRFVFPDSEESVHQFLVELPPVFGRYYIHYTERGDEYAGYVIAVLDSRGDLVMCDTDLSMNWVKDDLPKSVKKLRVLYLEGLGSRYSRHFDESIRKVQPPQPEWYERYRTY